MIAFALDAVTSFSFFPLQVMLYISLVLAVLSLAVGIVISALRIAMGEEFFGGQATTIVLLLLMSSFQLFFLFILGQYVARSYDETRDRPLYVVASTAGLDRAQVGNQRRSVVETPSPRMSDGDRRATLKAYGENDV